MIPTSHVVRSTDPWRAELEAAGYVVVAESWGARLRISEGFDFRALHAAIEHVEASGLRIEELDARFAAALVDLEVDNQADYPCTPATPHQAPSLDAAVQMWVNGSRVFGCYEADGSPVCPH